MTDCQIMPEEVVLKAYNLYGIKPVALLPRQKGYRNYSYPAAINGQARANLILYKNEPGILVRIKRTNAALKFLAGRGEPVRRVLDDRILLVKSNNAQRYCSLYSYLPGVTIPWEAYTRAHIKLLGEALANLHKALTTFANPALPAAEQEHAQLVSKMRQYFADPGVAAAARQKLAMTITSPKFDLYESLLKLCRSLPGRQPLHMDFVRSNILFDNNKPPKITGIIDFEKMAFGHPIFDLARTLAFLEVDCQNKTPGQIQRAFLVSGYIRRGDSKHTNYFFNASGRRISAIDELIDMFLLYDLYKFMRHNPYESLAQNHHFVRTRELLLARQVIEPASGSRL